MVKIISTLKKSVGFRSFNAFKAPSTDESCELILSLLTTAQHLQPQRANGYFYPSQGFSRAHGRHLLAAAPTRAPPTDRNSAFQENGFVKSTNTLLRREYCYCFNKQFK